MIKINIFLAVLALTSCTDIPLELYKEGYKSLTTSMSDANPIDINESYVSNKPFDVIRLRVGRSEAVIMVLVNNANGIKEWISSDRVKIFTENGKVIKTIGLKHDIELNDFKKYLLNRDQKSGSFTSNFIEPKLLYLETQFDYAFTDERYIKNIIEKRDSVLVDVYEENIFIERLHWRTRNFYFVRDGKIVRTEQQIHPLMKKISIDYVDAY